MNQMDALDRSLLSGTMIGGAEATEAPPDVSFALGGSEEDDEPLDSMALTKQSNGNANARANAYAHVLGA